MDKEGSLATPMCHKPKIIFLLIFILNLFFSYSAIAGPVKPPLKFEKKTWEDNSIQLEIVTADGSTIYFSTDGSIPGPLNPKTFVYKHPLHFSTTTLVRAYAQGPQGQSATRSILVLPERWRVFMGTTLHWPRRVKHVYVTGEMRNWNTHPDGAYALSQNRDGSWSATLPLHPEPGTQYKFIVVFEDGSWAWHVDPQTAQVGHHPYNAHEVPDPLHIFFKSIYGSHKNFFDDSLIFFQNEFIADVANTSKPLKHCVEFPKGQVESLSILFSTGQTYPLHPTGQSHHKHAQWLQQFCGQIPLVEVQGSTEYVFAAKKGGRVFFLGPQGIQAEGRFSFDSSEKETFPFSVSEDGTHINGHSMYEIPHWAIGATWYQIFPERFRKGQSSNPPAGVDYSPFFQRVLRSLPIAPPRGATPWAQNWFSLSPQEWSFADAILKSSNGTQNFQTVANTLREMILLRRYGGDFEGIKEKIPYLKSLGVDALYLNPIFQSTSHHKYDTVDYRHVDAPFGPYHGTNPHIQALDQDILEKEDVFRPETWGYTAADLAFMGLVKELHDNGLKVVIDGVFNHSAVLSPFMQDVAKRGPNSPFFPWFDIVMKDSGPGGSHHSCHLQDYYPDATKYPYAPYIFYASWWGFCTLPNHKNTYPQTVLHPTLKEFIFQVMDRWLTPKVVNGIAFPGIDGVRLDVYGDVPRAFWKAFRKQVKSKNPKALIVAEEWHDGVDILRGDEADGIMNYNVRTLAESWMLNTVDPYRFTPGQARGFAEWKVAQYKDHVALGLWSMLSSHDTDRVISKTLEPNRRTSARPFEANMWNEGYVNRPDQGAWYTNAKPNDSDKELFKSVVAFQMAYPGSPLIYYGDEVGMWGAADPTCRKPMAWPDTHANATETLCRPPYSYCPEFLLDTNTTVSAAPDLAMLEFYRSLTDARKRHPSLRYGTLQPWLEIHTLEHGIFRTGYGSMEHSYIWGFVRDYGPGEDLTYFVSNQRRGFMGQKMRVKTAFEPGTQVYEYVGQNTITVEDGGWVSLFLEADRAALFTQLK